MRRTALMGLTAGAFVAALAYSVAPAYAHHSFAATYFEDKTESVEGELVQFLFRNPHSFVHVEDVAAQGNTVRYAVEWGAGLQLNRQGVTRETLKPGDHVIITGNPGPQPGRSPAADAHHHPAVRLPEVGRHLRLNDESGHLVILVIWSFPSMPNQWPDD